MAIITDQRTDIPDSREARRRRLRSRRIRAVLAGGVVLGIGAAVTLAAWNDSENVTGTFTAGNFDLEGSTNGTDFASHVGTPAALTFTVAPAALSPGDSVSAPVALRLAAGADYDADVSISLSEASGNVDELSYSIVETASFGCAAGDELVADTAIATAADLASFGLTAGADPDPGDAIFLCITVTAGAGLTQGQSGGATWEFAAVSL